MDDAELLELAQGVLIGLGLGDVARAVEDLAVVKAKEGVEARGPVLHGHRDLSAGAGLSQVEEGVDQAAEVFEFIAGEVVDVIWQDLAVGAACPSGQAHVGLVDSKTSSAAVGPWTA